MVVKFIALVSCIDRFAFFKEGCDALAATICGSESYKPLHSYAHEPLQTESWSATITHRQGDGL